MFCVFRTQPQTPFNNLHPLKPGQTHHALPKTKHVGRFATHLLLLREEDGDQKQVRQKSTGVHYFQIGVWGKWNEIQRFSRKKF